MFFCIVIEYTICSRMNSKIFSHILNILKYSYKCISVILYYCSRVSASQTKKRYFSDAEYFQSCCFVDQFHTCLHFWACFIILICVSGRGRKSQPGQKYHGARIVQLSNRPMAVVYHNPL